MNLDDVAYFKTLDSTNLLAQIDSLPDQIEHGWALRQKLPPHDLSGVTQVALCGIGTSATSGALLRDLVANECRLPLHLLQAQELPAWVHGKNTLVIILDDAEESAAQARERGCRFVELSTAEMRNQLAGEALATLLALFSRAGWIRDYAEDVSSAVVALREQQKTLRAESPVMRNPAKRMAGQFMDRFVLVFGAGILNAAARYWAERVQLYAKAWAQAEALPHALPAAIAGTLNPEGLISKFMFINLECESLSSQEKALAHATREHFMTSGFNTDFIRGVGPTPLAQLLTCLHYADYVGYYLAMAYRVDPS